MRRRGWGLLTAIGAGLGLLALTLLGAGAARAEVTATRAVCLSGCMYETLGAALAAAQDGDLITLASGTYSETGQLLITRSLTISGLDALNPPVIRPLSDTMRVADGRGFLVVGASGALTLTGVTFDGSAAAIHEALRLHGPTHLDQVTVRHIQTVDESDPAGGLLGTGVWIDGAAVTLTGVTVADVGRAGVVADGPTRLVWHGGAYQGGGSRLQYGLAAGGGAQVALDEVKLEGAQGTSQNQVAAGVRLSSVAQVGASGYSLAQVPTRVTITHGTLVSNTVGVLIGTADDDPAEATIHSSRIVGNTNAGIMARNIQLNHDVRGNWWGCNTGPNSPGCDRALGTLDARQPLQLTLLAGAMRARWGETRFISATLRTDAPSHTIPDGTALAWNADRGQLGAATGVWNHGYAWTVWTAPLVDGPATLGVQVDGQLVTAGVEVAASTPSRIRLPLVTNELLTMPLTNGYFSDGLNGWGVGRGGFMGHGSGLPVGRLFEGGNPRILLGDATAISGTIPVGYGYLNQTFVVGARYLEINYRMFTEDLILGGNRYFDTFEVALNTFPDQITDVERTARGCQTAANPGSVVVPGTGGLVFCAGNPGEREGKLQETGWRTARLDLAAWRGRKITLFMTLWSREYDAPYQNNQAFYNSWVFVDDIRETESAANELQSLETLWPLVLGGSESTPSGLLPRR